MTPISIYQIGHWEGSQYTAILQSASGISSSSWLGFFLPLQPHAYVKSWEYNYINCTFSTNTFSRIKVLILLHTKNTLHRFISFNCYANT